MKCPVDSSSMIVVERHGIELDYCTSCRGIWFDTGELRLLSSALGVNIKLPDIAGLPKTESMEKPRPCPRCDAKMDKIRLNRVLVDRCPRGHGLWFDSGELGQMLDEPPDGAGGAGQITKFLGETIKTNK